MSRAIIPGLADAIAKQDLVRDAAFLVDREHIAGVAVRPLTVRDLAALQAIGSPFMVGKQPGAGDVAAFLWLLHPKYHPRARVRRWLFLQSLRRRNFIKLVEGIREYIAESFQDTPGGTSTTEPSYYSVAAALVGMFASNYGWSETEILNLPVKRALQYRAEIMRRINPDSILFNPSDRVVGEWLTKRNLQPAEN